MNILDYFQFTFIQRGFIVGMIIAILGAILGHFLVLKKLALIGHALSHIAYLSIAISIVFFQQSLWINLLFASVAALLIEWLVRKNPQQSDVIIGVLSAIGVALGTIVITTNPNQNVTVEQFLFGSILLLRHIDMMSIIILGVLIVAFVILYYEDLATLTFDRDFGRVIGLKSYWLDATLALLASWLIILGIRAVGALMISSFIMFPTLIASPLVKSFKGAFFLGTMISVVVFVIGFLLSLGFDWPTGSTIIVVYGVVWMLTFFIQPLRRVR
jgi:zinc transport system permease protein